MRQLCFSPFRHPIIVASLLLVFPPALLSFSGKVASEEPSEERAPAPSSGRLLAPVEPPLWEEEEKVEVENLDLHNDGNEGSNGVALEEALDEAVDPELQEQTARILDEIREQRIADEAEDFELLKEIEELREVVSTDWRPVARMPQNVFWEPAMRVVFRKHAENEVSAFWPEPTVATQHVKEAAVNWCEKQLIKTISQEVVKKVQGTEEVEVPEIITKEISVNVIAPCGFYPTTLERACDAFTVAHGVVDTRQLPLYRGDGRRATWQQFLAARNVGDTVGVLLLASREHWTAELGQLLSPDAYVVIADSRAVHPLTSLIEPEDLSHHELVAMLPVIARRSPHSDHRFAFSPYVRAMVNGSTIHASMPFSASLPSSDTTFHEANHGIGHIPPRLTDVPPGYVGETEFLQGARRLDEEENQFDCPSGGRWPQIFAVTFDPRDWTRMNGTLPTPLEIELRLAQDRPVLLADNLDPNAGYHYDHKPYPGSDSDPYPAYPESEYDAPPPPAPVEEPSASRAIRMNRSKSPAGTSALGPQETTFVSTESRGCGCGGAAESPVKSATYPIGFDTPDEPDSLEELWKDIFRPEIPIFRPHSPEALAVQAEDAVQAEHATTAERSANATDHRSNHPSMPNRIGHIAVDWNPPVDRVGSRREQIDLVFEARKLRRTGRPREAAAKLSGVTQFDLVEPHEFYVLAHELHRRGHLELAEGMLGMAIQWDPSHFQRSRLERYQGHSRIWLEETQDTMRWRWEAAAGDNEKKARKLSELQQRLNERWWQTRLYTPNEVDLEAIRHYLPPEAEWEPADDEPPAEPVPEP